MELRKTLSEIVTDIIHVLYGVITSTVSFFNPTLSIFFFTIYITYQYTEYIGDRDLRSLLGDLVEYTVGLVIGSFLIMQKTLISCFI